MTHGCLWRSTLIQASTPLCTGDNMVKLSKAYLFYGVYYTPEIKTKQLTLQQICSSYCHYWQM